MTHKGLAQLILAWAKSTFGEVASDPVERAARVLEEAAEVAQGGGVSKEMALAIVERTYSRPPDSVEKEIGGLLVTVYALSAVHHLDPQECLEREVARVLAKDPSMWRAKHNDKVKAGTSTAVAS